MSIPISFGNGEDPDSSFGDIEGLQQNPRRYPKSIMYSKLLKINGLKTEPTQTKNDTKSSVFTIILSYTNSFKRYHIYKRFFSFDGYRFIF